MIKFFRAIRKSMINSNRFNKYLLYTIDFENSFVQLRAKSAEEKIIQLKAFISQELNSTKQF